jgi:SlyX protein
MDLTALEERVAHLQAAVDDLSQVVARQDRVIDRLDRIVRELAERDVGAPPDANQRPPHW